MLTGFLFFSSLLSLSALNLRKIYKIGIFFLPSVLVRCRKLSVQGKLLHFVEYEKKKR